MCVGDERPVPLTTKLRQEYEKMYSRQVLQSQRVPQIQQAVEQVEAGKPSYEEVAEITKVPWYVIGIIHLLECNSRFDCHLHNGDSLAHRTTHVPSGRPTRGSPPFSWKDSAVDALELDGFDAWTDWSVAGTLYKLEAYNGFGSRNKGIASPYLWGGTTFYRRGKYVRDGVWSSTTVSTQVGAGPLLYTMNKESVIEFPSVQK